MEFTVKKQALLEALQVLGAVVAPRGVRPILNNVHVSVDPDNGCRLTGTDLEISLRYKLALVSCKGAGEALLPSSRTLSIVREAPGDTITISEETAGKLAIRAGRSVFEILSENAAEFPTIPEYTAAFALTIEQQKLMRLIRKTQFAVAKEKSRFGFNGAMLHATPTEVRMIATDGKRLVMSWDAVASEGSTVRPIIPLRALGAFDKVLALDAGSVNLSFDDKEIVLRTPRAEVSARLVEGQYPDYQAVIPKEPPMKVRFLRDELSSAFRQAAILTSQDSRSVRVHFEDGKATFKAQAPDAGAATIDVDAPDYTGEAISVAFNPDYFDEGLKVMEAQTVTIGLSRANQPVTVTGDADFLYVVMPITLRNA